MTDMSAEEAIEETRKAAISDRRIRAVPIPLASVDAALSFYFSVAGSEQMRISRTVLTLGSLEYHFEFYSGKRNKHVRVMTLFIRSIDINITVLDARPMPDFQEVAAPSEPDLFGTILVWLRGFYAWHQNEHNKITEAAHQLVGGNTIAADIDAINKTLAAIVPTQPRSPGRSQDSDYEWARREIALGRDYEETFRGFLKRRPDINIADPRAYASEKERFRKAMQYKPKARRK